MSNRNGGFCYIYLYVHPSNRKSTGLEIDKVAPLSVSGNIRELPLLAASLEFEYHLWLVQEI